MKSAHINILETGATSLAAGAEDPDYPLYRLYDRNIGRFFKPTAVGTTSVRVDQGSDVKTIDRLLVPAGHNLDGQALRLKWSDDDAVYTPAVSDWTQSGNGLIEKSFAPLTHRYWKFTVSGAPVIIQVAELFLTSTYEWERDPVRPAGPLEDVFNVEAAVTSAGQDRFLIHGDPKRQRVYLIPRAGGAMKDKLVELYGSWAGAKPFWLYDHEGAWIYGRLRSPIGLMEVAYQQYKISFDFQEVLP